MKGLAFDLAHLLAGGLVLVSFMLLYQNRLYSLLNVFALQAVVLALSVAWQAYVQGAPHLYVTAAITIVFKAMIIPIADRHQEYANKVLEQLKAAGIRAEVDIRSERMNLKIRDAQMQKIPYMLVVGDKEAAAEAVSVRLRTNVDLKSIPVTELITRVSEIAKTKSMEL